MLASTATAAALASLAFVPTTDPGMTPQETAIRLRELATMAELAAEEAEVLETILERIPVVMTVGNETGWILVSKTFSDVLGYTREDLNSTPFEALIHPDDLQDTLDAVAEVQSGKKETGRVTNRYRVKGTDEYVLLHWAWGPGGGPQGLTVAAAMIEE